jgi:hypothetical protein
MDGKGWSDDELLALLGEASRRAGEPTPTMAAAAEAAYSWRTIDSELATLTYDSLAEEAALVRDAGTATRQLVFEGQALGVELEQGPEGVVGQLVPPGPGTVTVLGPSGELSIVQADDLGLFRVEWVRPGPVRLRCVTATDDILTGWL